MEFHNRRKVMKMKNVEVISGTLRNQDLVPAILDFLREHAPDWYAEHTMRPFPLPPTYVQDEGDDSEWWQSEECGEFVGELFNAMDIHLAPEEHYFGPHPGDGSCFGFWEHEDAPWRGDEDQLDRTQDANTDININININTDNYEPCDITLARSMERSEPGDIEVLPVPIAEKYTQRVTVWVVEFAPLGDNSVGGWDWYYTEQAARDRVGELYQLNPDDNGSYQTAMQTIEVPFASPDTITYFIADSDKLFL